MKDARTEFWTLCFKTLLLSYLISLAYVNDVIMTPWFILFILLYISLNVSFYLSKESLKLLLMVLSMAFIIVSHYFVHPLLILLLPVNICEFATSIFKKGRIGYFLIPAPLFVLTDDMISAYTFISVLSFVYFTMMKGYANKLQTYQQEIDQLRSDFNRLTVRLDVSREYIRQSEYSFKLEERNRLSQEVHDKLGHSMTGALIQMEAAKLLLVVDQEKSAELLQNAIQISKDGIESIRLVLKNEKPLTEQLGINRIKLLLDEFTSKHSIKSLFTYDGNLDMIVPIQWKIIQGNMLEALNNILKYANATIVSIHIEVLNSIIKVVMADNGIGATRIIKGLGLIGMEERTTEINGKIIVDGSRGFSVTTLIPYEKHKRRHESKHEETHQ